MDESTGNSRERVITIEIAASAAGARSLDERITAIVKREDLASAELTSQHVETRGAGAAFVTALGMATLTVQSTRLVRRVLDEIVALTADLSDVPPLTISVDGYEVDYVSLTDDERAALLGGV